MCWCALIISFRIFPQESRSAILDVLSILSTLALAYSETCSTILVLPSVLLLTTGTKLATEPVSKSVHGLISARIAPRAVALSPTRVRDSAFLLVLAAGLTT